MQQSRGRLGGRTQRLRQRQAGQVEKITDGTIHRNTRPCHALPVHGDDATVRQEFNVATDECISAGRHSGDMHRIGDKNTTRGSFHALSDAHMFAR